MSYEKIINVANPSNKDRNGYVGVSLDFLAFPHSFFSHARNELRDDKTTSNFRLSLYRNEEKVPYQIDHVFGSDFIDKGVLVFKSDNIPGKENNEDYNTPSAKFVLKEDEPSAIYIPESLWAGYYYEPPNPPEGLFFSRKILPDKELYGIKLYNGKIEIFFSLKRQLDPNVEVNYTGTVTSVNLHDEKTPEGDLTAPFVLIDDKPFWARWGQVTDIVFYPTPWDLSWFQKESLWSKDYELVYKKNGPVRAVASFRAGPFFVSYRGAPFFAPKTKTVKCYLYRILYAFPLQSCYGEELVVLTTDGHSLSFRPYFLSSVHAPHIQGTSLHRFEHVPDYFAIWKVFASLDYGYGFTSDAHIRGIEVIGNDIRWRLPSSHMKTCVHCFVCINNKEETITERLKFIGDKWYEQVFKPLRATPISQAFYSPIPDDV